MNHTGNTTYSYAAMTLFLGQHSRCDMFAGALHLQILVEDGVETTNWNSNLLFSDDCYIAWHASPVLPYSHSIMLQAICYMDYLPKITQISLNLSCHGC